MRALLALGIGLGLAGWTAAGDWPQFRGTDSTGIADDARPPAEWGPDKNVQWKVKVPGVAWSSPVIWGDRVFVTTAITDNQRKPTGGYPGGPAGGGSPGGFGGPPQPGQLLPGFTRQRLNLTAEQTRQLDDLQKDIDGKLAAILTDEQKKQLREAP